MNAWVTRQVMDTITRVQRRLDRISTEMEEMERTMASLAAMVSQEPSADLRQIAENARRYREDMARLTTTHPFTHPDDCPICERATRLVEEHRQELDAKRCPLDMRVGGVTDREREE